MSLVLSWWRIIADARVVLLTLLITIAGLGLGDVKTP